MTGCVTGSYLEWVLDRYSTLVEEKKTKKIGCTAWKQLVKAANGNATVDVNVCGSWVTIKISKGEYIVIENPVLAELFGAGLGNKLTQPETTISDTSTTVGEACSSLGTSLTDWHATALVPPVNLATTATAINGCYDNKLTTTGTPSCDNKSIIADYSYYDDRSTVTVPLYDSNFTISVDDIRLYEFKNDEYIKIGKEKEDMNMFKNFEFGPVTTDSVKMSMYGLCVKNKAGTYVAYDSKSGDMMDVDILNFNGKNFLYQVPVALDQITEGMIIVHNRVPMFVINVPQDRKSLDVIDPYAGERKEILPARSPFGFDFVTRIVSLFDQFTGSNKADASNPFGNMLPLLMMADGSKNEKDILPLMLMMGGNVDPMMAMVMMNGDNKDMLLPMMFMMNSQNHICSCGGQCNGSHN